MNVAVTALAALIFASSPAFAAGFERATVPDPGGPALEAGIWYPSAATASAQPLGPYRHTVASGGAVAGRDLPLVVMSHGSGGSLDGHHDTAVALADAGFVVAAVTHTGDNFRDQSGFTRVENRPRHLKAAVDYMLAAWPYRALLDPRRIGVFGFSAGGFTALAAIGGEPDLSLVAANCTAHPEEWACRRGKGSEMTVGSGAFVPDRRIVAAVVAAPAIGYTFTPKGLAGITAPIQLWRGDSDEILPHPRHAQHVYEGLAVKPDYHVVPRAGHFAFMAPCSQMLEGIAPEICRDPAGFDRTAFHREFNAEIVGFFMKRLAAQP